MLSKLLNRMFQNSSHCLYISCLWLFWFQFSATKSS